MATTSSNLTVGKSSAGQGSNGSNGRFGLKSKLVTGMVILGCTAALLLGGLRARQAAQTPPQAAPQAVSLPAGTNDLATTGCIGNTGPFACQSGQSLFGTDDFATTGCIGTAGPFACATIRTAVMHGTDDLATNWCVGTDGPFACAVFTPHIYVAPSTFVPDQFTYREDHRGAR